MRSSLLFAAICVVLALASSVTAENDKSHKTRHAQVPQQTLPLTPPEGYTAGDRVGGIHSKRQRHPHDSGKKRKRCTVHPLGWDRDDAPQIHAAVEKCGVDGIIELPAPYVYTIKSRLATTLIRSRLNVYGTLSFAPDLGYWYDNSHRIEFQNQSTAWIVQGEDYTIDGGGWNQGGIHGNGQAWYTASRSQSNRFGRPIPLSLYNSSRVVIKDFAIRDSAFWNFYVQDSHDILLKGLYLNGTNTDHEAGQGNYEINIDGFNSLRTDDVVAEDWVFKGGDDCLSPKGNSTNMVFQNITCFGGGIAFGSVGQYVGKPDTIRNITVKDIKVATDIRPRYGGAGVAAGAYFKSWVGVEAGVPPQGGGGGTGRVHDIHFENLTVRNTSQAVFVNKCYFKVPSQASACDTSTLVFEDLHFRDVRGTYTNPAGINLNCSALAPCDDITFKRVDLHPATDKEAEGVVKCTNTEQVEGVTCD